MMLSQRHLPEDELSLFALQLLEGEELDRALEHLEHCEECRHDVARFQGDLVGYALAMSEMHSPPAQARERLLKKVAKEKKVVPVERPAPVERALPVQRAVPAERPTPMPAERLPAERPLQQAERPLQQVAERLAERASGTVPVAAAGNGDGRNEPRPQLRAADSELFLASRGRGMFGTSAEDDDVADHRRSKRGLLITMAATGWAIAACMAVMAGLQYRQRQNVQMDNTAMASKLDRIHATLDDAQSKLDTFTDPSAMQVALTTGVQPAKPEGHASYMADRGALVFIGDHLAPLPQGKTYELWLLQPALNGAEQPPIPAGLFKPDVRGVASVVMPDIPKGVAAQGFGVTMENDGGASTPTKPIVLVGF